VVAPGGSTYTAGSSAASGSSLREDAQLLVDVMCHIGQATATTGIDIGGDPARQKYSPAGRCLEASRHRHRPRESSSSPSKTGSFGSSRPTGVDRTPAESAEVDLKHSRLN
jgi:hypothetical protein